MSATYENFVHDVLKTNKRDQNVDVQTFLYWIRTRAADHQKDNIVYHLACAVNEQQNAPKDSAWNKPSKAEQRDDGRIVRKNKDITTALINRVDSLTQKQKTCAIAMSPVPPESLLSGIHSTTTAADTSLVVYQPWFGFLMSQCRLLSHLDELLTRNVSLCMVGNGDPTTLAHDVSAHFVAVNISVAPNEAPHLKISEVAGRDDNRAQYALVEELRHLVLFRIQHCLTTRAVTGAFIDSVDHYTEIQQKLYNVALSRQLVVLGLSRIEALHEQRPALSYEQILAHLSRDSKQLRNRYSLTEEEFIDKVLNYAKVKENRVSAAFERQVKLLLADYDKWCAANDDQTVEALRRQAKQQRECETATTTTKGVKTRKTHKKLPKNTQKQVPKRKEGHKKDGRTESRTTTMRKKKRKIYEVDSEDAEGEAENDEDCSSYNGDDPYSRFPDDNDDDDDENDVDTQEKAVHDEKTAAAKQPHETMLFSTAPSLSNFHMLPPSHEIDYSVFPPLFENAMPEPLPSGGCYDSFQVTPAGSCRSCICNQAIIANLEDQVNEMMRREETHLERIRTLEQQIVRQQQIFLQQLHKVKRKNCDQVSIRQSATAAAFSTSFSVRSSAAANNMYLSAVFCAKK